MQIFYEETQIREANEIMDRGVPPDEVLSDLSSKFPHYHEPIHLWQEQRLKMFVGPIEGAVKILEELKKREYPIYALSNWGETFHTHIKHNYHFIELFDDIVISYDVKIAKPDPKIYQILLDRNNLEPENCIFIDDSEKNVEAAKNLGIHGIKFFSPEQLADELKQYDIFV